MNLQSAKDVWNAPTDGSRGYVKDSLEQSKFSVGTAENGPFEGAPIELLFSLLALEQTTIAHHEMLLPVLRDSRVQSRRVTSTGLFEKSYKKE